MKNKLLYLIILIMIVIVAGCSKQMSRSESGSTTGKAGSMARFTIKGNYLYTLSKKNLNTFDISENENPVKIDEERIGPDIETIFPYKDMLFLGTRTGMIIYKIHDKGKAKFLSEIDHFYSCDPVVVNNDYAYVTLRAGSMCRGGKNELNIYDVANPKRPKLIKTYSMKGPLGLGVVNNTLFVLDGPAGLKLFNVKNPEKAFVFETVKKINGYDLIPYEDVLIISAEDGIYQYNYQTFPLRFLSKIEVGSRAGIAK